MGSTLFNTTPQNTYPSLIKIGDNLPLSGTLKVLSDGNGNDSVLALSTISLQIGGATGATWDNTNKRLGIGTTTPAFTIDAVGGVQATGIIRGERVQVGTAATLNDATGVGNTLQFANYNPSVFVTASADSYIYKNSNVFGGLPAQTLIFQTRSDTTGGGFSFVAGGTPAPIVTMLGTGNVGIGTTSPNIYATGGATNIVSIQATGTDAGAILDIAGTGTGFSGVNMGNESIRRAFLGTIDGGNFGIYTNPTNTGTVVTERLTITAAGNVGIGTSTPTATLNIKATGSNNSDNLAQVLTNSELRLQYRADDVSSLYIGGLGSERGYLQGINNTQNAGADISLNPYGGNVGIGTSSPSAMLTLNSTTPYIRIERTGVPTWQIQNNTLVSTAGFSINNVTNATTPFFIDGTTNNVGIGTGAPTELLELSALTDPKIRFLDQGNLDAKIGIIGSVALGFELNGLERMRIVSDGTLRLSSNSGGIQFNGDTAAANALDDYEEGTFTATITPSTSGTITSGGTFITWTYTKIGRQVTINGVFVISSVSSPIGTGIVIGGLPYTIFNNNGAYGAFACTYFTAATTTNVSIGARHSINTTQLVLGKDASTVAPSDEIYVTATYFV
jgi:hypothetical protein